MFMIYRFFVVNLAIVYFYFSIFQSVNEEEFGGVSEIMKEGLMTSFATFIVCTCYCGTDFNSSMVTALKIEIFSHS